MMRDYAVAQLKQREEKIAAHRAQITQLEGEVVVLEAESRLLRDILEHVSVDETPKPEATPRIRVRRQRRKARGLSDTWRLVLANVQLRYPRAVRLHRIYKLAEEHCGLQPESVRSQLATYVNRGYLERSAPGRFRMSPEQAELAGVTAGDIEQARQMKETPPENQSEGVSDNTGEVDASPNESRKINDLLG